MKIADMNERQYRVFVEVKELCCDVVGGFANTLMDYPKDSVEYKEADEFLHQPREQLVDVLYQTLVQESLNSSFNKDLKFVGKQFIIERIEKRLNKLDY